MKQVQVPNGGIVKFGRRAMPIGRPHMRLSNYLRAALPAPPPVSDFSPKAGVALSDVYGNDSLGDCVIAGGYHIEGVETGNAGTIFHATSSQIISDYSAICGYVPGDPSTDNGGNLQDALNYWTSHGFANGTKLLGWLAVNATNKTEVQQACFLFENLYLGMGLPDAWINPFPSGNGFTWDVAGASNPSNGHCIMGCGYNATGIKVDTWGLLGTQTYAALAEYASAKTGGELYVLLSPDQVTKGQIKAPNGVDWASLIADFDAMGGHVPVPGPIPVPPPTPTPTPGKVTLAQAEAAVKAAFAASHLLLARSQAVSIANKALAGLPW
jgi:hypothetical protein